ncbi:MAG: tyrosine-type recombinase/integrase [Microlunatus sp.]|nr:tyrosine-type recombinase/integrase [Microlunatus sp.]
MLVGVVVVQHHVQFHVGDRPWRPSSESRGPRPCRSRIRSLIEAISSEEPDAFTWLTSHVFRKTTATILDDAGQSARQVADQMGHSRPSMTQDVYMGRRAVDSQAALALEAALRDVLPDNEKGGKSVVEADARDA